MKQEFSAVIQQHEGINGAYVEPPFDVEAVFGAKRVKVLATFDGEPYRGSLVRMGGCYLIGMPQNIRKKIAKGFGDTVFVTIQKDEAERVVQVPEDFKQNLSDNAAATATFEKLSYSAKKDYIDWINDAKQAQTRMRRIEQALSLLAEGKKRK